jgi:Protein of unknown function (DUF1036)
MSVLRPPSRTKWRVFTEKAHGKVAAGGIGAIVAGVLLAPIISGSSEIRVCNSAPYLTEHVVVAAKDQGYEALGGWFRLAPGECTTKAKRFWQTDPAFYVHTQIPSDEHQVLRWVNDIVDAQLLNDDDTSNDTNITKLQGHEARWFGDTAICAENEQSVPSQALQLTADCTAGAYEARVMPAFSPDKSSRWYFIWAHPNLPLMPADGTFEAALEKALAGARQLRTSVMTQRFNEREWPVVPFSVGGTLVDLNGPLALGVWVTDVPSTTIFGQPMPIENGDVVLKVNGYTVLGARDLHQKLIDHGLSRKAGIEKPVRYTILRGNDPYEVETTYFFNERYRQATPNQEGVAFWYGVGDGITFGQTPWVMCNGSNLLRAGAKGVSKVAEFVSSRWQKRQYDASNEMQVEYIDAAECQWQEKQGRAFARQKADDTYVNSQWFALFTPSGVRLVGGKFVGAKVAQIVGKNTTMSRALASGVLEAAETALWSVGTAAPGTPLSARIGEAAKLAPWGAAAGLVTTAALRYKSK